MGLFLMDNGKDESGAYCINTVNFGKTKHFSPVKCMDYLV